MFTIHQKNQQFKTTDIVSMFALVAIGASLSGAVLARGFEGGKVGRAQNSAEAIAMQLSEAAELPVNIEPVGAPSPTLGTPGRAPANVGGTKSPMVETGQTLFGDIGRDPWGGPFHYLVFKGSGHQRVVVWSDGANRTSESVASVRQNLQDFIENGSLDQGRTALFLGDDLGFAIEK